ncbi:ammonia monooxygenase [Sinorhizobium sp. LM21]|nr:ammonia monooxygenase [Sinorhizobium phage phi3LM21]OWZ90941.1 ammonia monooxygenase [Sinorhizobium sp. LM21]
MAVLSRKLRTVEGGRLMFWCPGCDGAHQVRIGEGPGPRWGYNGNPERPTFTPSVLVRSGHYVPGQEGKSCWCTYNAEHPDDPAPFKCSICHSFVTDGHIRFLGDCTHELAGQTVEIPDWEDA